MAPSRTNTKQRSATPGDALGAIVRHGARIEIAALAATGSVLAGWARAADSILSLNWARLGLVVLGAAWAMLRSRDRPAYRCPTCGSRRADGHADECPGRSRS